jgi:hypothetical protein
MALTTKTYNYANMTIISIISINGKETFAYDKEINENVKNKILTSASPFFYVEYVKNSYSIYYNTLGFINPFEWNMECDSSQYYYADISGLTEENLFKMFEVLNSYDINVDNEFNFIGFNGRYKIISPFTTKLNDIKNNTYGEIIDIIDKELEILHPGYNFKMPNILNYI